MDTVRVQGFEWQTFNVRTAARIVGFYEYTSALRKFDQLVQSATPEELEVIETIIAKRDELAIAINLSAKFPHPPNVLDQTSDDPNDTFVRQGLAWLMALARNEVAAATAGFTGQEDPFRFIGATQFELPAYREMLLDGLRMHYWALAADLDLPQVRKGRAEIHRLMVYGRRLFMMREMLQTCRTLAHDATPEQRKELNDWDDNLADIQSDVIAEIVEYIYRAPPSEIVHLPCPSLQSAVQMGLVNRRVNRPATAPVSAGAPSKSSAPTSAGP